MEHSTPIRSMAQTNNDNNNQHSSMELDELDSIDVESLRLVFGSEDLNKRKPHELRELWMQKQKDAKTKRMPRFLLDPKNKDHVAPHAFALQLLLRRKGNKSNGDGLYKKVSRSEQLNEHNNSSSTSHQYNQSRNSNNSTKDLGIFVHLALVILAVVVLICQFTLEVLGGAGAIWGCAEIARLRKGGPIDPSWDFFTWLALGVGICCFGRFLLVHPFFPNSDDESFFPKYKLHSASFLQLAKAVASDPVLFLRPKRLGCCGCYCVCQKPSFDEEECIPSPASLGKVSPQRSTWDMSDDESDDLQLREFDA